MRIKETTVSGLLLCALGGVVAIYSATQYEVGKLSNIGPGAFPLGLGSLLLIFGIILLIQSVATHDRIPGIEWRSVIFVMGGLLLFAMTVGHLGLLVAAFAGGGTAALADRETKPVKALVIGACLAAISASLFVMVLGMPMKLVAWRF